MSSVRKILSFILWRIKFPRYILKTMCELKLSVFKNTAPQKAFSKNKYLELVNDIGYCKVSDELHIPSIDLSHFSGVAEGKTFVDIGGQLADTKESLFVALMGTAGIQDLINGYFDGSPHLWNVALNYSDPSNIPTDSQLWHFDYGDVRQLHLLVYLSNVDDKSGPFSFLDKKTSLVAKRSPWFVERWTDNQLGDLGLNLASDVIRLTGLRGDVFATDPGVVLHQGARCERPRLVMFVTFTTKCPLSRAPKHTIKQAERNRLREAYFSSNINHQLDKKVFSV